MSENKPTKNLKALPLLGTKKAEPVFCVYYQSAGGRFHFKIAIYPYTVWIVTAIIVAATKGPIGEVLKHLGPLIGRSG